MGSRESVIASFRAHLAQTPLLLSGGVGTELLRRGVSTPLPLWSTAALDVDPDAVRDVHADYVRAGARLVTANTFRTDRGTLARVGRQSEARALTKRAVELARAGVARARPRHAVFVAASMAPLADCYRPQDVAPEETLRAQHGLRAGDLVAAGADLAMIETMNTVREARAALGATRAAALPAVVSFVLGADGALLSGEPVEEAARAVADLEALAICVNCCAPAAATVALEALARVTELPIGVYANGRGRPDEAQGWRFEGGVGDRAYLRHARDWLDRGARLIGGCCGTTPRTIRKLARLLRRRG